MSQKGSTNGIGHMHTTNEPGTPVHIASSAARIVALGNKATQEGDFYASLHQEQEEVKLGIEKMEKTLGA